MNMKAMSVFAFAGVVGLAGGAGAKPWDHERPVAPTREGMPPIGSIRSEFSVRVAHDGRADTGGRESAVRDEPRARTERPDSDLGQQRHTALPIKSDVLQRVSMGDGPESLKQPASKAQAAQQPRDAKVYPGRHENPPAPLPIKSSVLLQVSGGGEAGGLNENRSDDPKLDRNRSNMQHKSNNDITPYTAGSTKVYPGRHEKVPTAPEGAMMVQKRQAAGNDAAGDKDAP